MSEEKQKVGASAEGDEEKAVETSSDERVETAEQTSESDDASSKKDAESTDEAVDKAAADEAADEAPESKAPESKAPKFGPKAEPAPARPSYLFFGVATAVFLVADLWSKDWAVKTLAKTNKSIPVFENVKIPFTEMYLSFHHDLAHNYGGAWGLLGDQPDSVRLPFFFIISAIALVFVFSLFRKLEPRQVALKWALPLVLGGAAGNFVDRVRHEYVVDFLDWFVVKEGGKAAHWPTFNVADIWICIGVGLMAVDMFTSKKAPATTEDEDEVRPTKVKKVEVKKVEEEGEAAR